MAVPLTEAICCCHGNILLQLGAISQLEAPVFSDGNHEFAMRSSVQLFPTTVAAHCLRRPAGAQCAPQEGAGVHYHIFTDKITASMSENFLSKLVSQFSRKPNEHRSAQMLF